MNKATVFVPLLSRHYTSGPCFSESIQAKRLNMPTIAACIDSQGWNTILNKPTGILILILILILNLGWNTILNKPTGKLVFDPMSMESIRYDISTKSKTLRDIYRDVKKIPIGDGTWPSPTGDFFGNMSSLATEIIKLLPQDDRPPLYALVLTAKAQVKFGASLCKTLNELGLKASQIESISEWSDSGTRALSIVPVLSQEFLLST